MFKLIQLLPPKRIGGYMPQNHSETALKEYFAFYKSKAGEYTHRVRSGICHWRDGQLHHVSLQLWCGAIGFTGDDSVGKPVSEPDPKAILCATCEGRAIGAGQDGPRKISGRFVKFAPRI